MIVAIVPLLLLLLLLLLLAVSRTSVEYTATMAMQQLSFKEKHRISKAQSARFDWTKLNGPSKGLGDLHRVVEAHAQAVGTPKEFFFMPLLTVAASFMGINAVVQINPEWLEPAIIWTVVAARKGEKKTAALNRILAAVEVSR